MHENLVRFFTCFGQLYENGSRGKNLRKILAFFNYIRYNALIGIFKPLRF